MAEDAVDEAIKRFDLKTKGEVLPDISGSGAMGIETNGQCATRRVVLVGSHGYSKQLPSQLMEHHKIESDVAYHLATNYGDRAWSLLNISQDEPKRLIPSHPFTESEIRFAVRHEAACTGADMIARRTRLAFLDVESALLALPRVLEIMGEELNWSKAKASSEWSDSVQFLKSMGLAQDKMGVSKAQVIEDKASAVASPKQKARAVSNNLNIQVGKMEN